MGGELRRRGKSELGTTGERAGTRVVESKCKIFLDEDFFFYSEHDIFQRRAGARANSERAR